MNILKGIVLNNKGEKTLSVLTARYTKHKCKKYFYKRKKYYSHDEYNLCNEKDFILIKNSKPISKNKN